jgi:putative membrane protein
MYLRDHNCKGVKGMTAEALADLMTLCFIGGVIAASSVVIHTTRAVGAQGESASAFELSYLYQAIEGQQAEVALGQMAVQKASSDEVKQFGARMMQDHLRASEELGKLTTQEGIRETGELSMPHQRIQRMLSQLSGMDFDKAYMAFMVRDHIKLIGDWEQRSPTLADPRVKHWIAGLLPVLKDHLEQGRTIAAAIGVNANDLAKVDEAMSPSNPLRVR